MYSKVISMSLFWLSLRRDINIVENKFLLQSLIDFCIVGHLIFMNNCQFLQIMLQEYNLFVEEINSIL